MSRLLGDIPPGASDDDIEGIAARCCMCGRAIDITGSDLPWDALCPEVRGQSGRALGAKRRMSKPITIELHLTYRCNLACVGCNRGCSLRTDHTPDLTLEQFSTFLDTCPPYARLVLLGGEPTLHPDCVEFAKMSLERSPEAKVIIYSNAYTPKSREVLKELLAMGIKNSGGTEKLDGSVDHQDPFIFVSPHDMGQPDRAEPCHWCAFKSCGFSVDSHGITSCAIGGAIDGILGLGLRTWDWNKVTMGQCLDLCRHCGHLYDWPTEPSTGRFWRGQMVSKTWDDAHNKP
jgi:hypothetical protein